MIKILFLAANPLSTTRLRLDEESRSIYYALQNSEFHDQFHLEKHYAVQVREIQGLILKYLPDIVHFSGHGSADDGIVLETPSSNIHTVSSSALSNLFSHFSNNIRCVILNACYSETQAIAISQHIDCVIGIRTEVDDKTSISFATAFYQALGYGQDIETAFNLACNQLELENLPKEYFPKLLIKHSQSGKLSFQPTNLIFNDRTTKSQRKNTNGSIGNEFPANLYEKRRGCYVDIKRGVIAVVISITILFLILSDVVSWTVKRLNTIFEWFPQPTPTVRATLIPTFTSTPVIAPSATNAIEENVTITPVALPILIPTDTPSSTVIVQVTPTIQTSLGLGNSSSSIQETATPTPTTIPTPSEILSDVPTNLEVTLDEPLGEYIFGRARFRWTPNFFINDLGPGYVFELVFWEDGQDPMTDGFSPLDASVATDIYIYMETVDSPDTPYKDTLKTNTKYQWGVILGRKSEDGIYKRIQFLKASHHFLWQLYTPPFHFPRY